jgi:hypothetical protein
MHMRWSFMCFQPDAHYHYLCCSIFVVAPAAVVPPAGIAAPAAAAIQLHQWKQPDIPGRLR